MRQVTDAGDGDDRKFQPFAGVEGDNFDTVFSGAITAAFKVNRGWWKRKGTMRLY